MALIELAVKKRAMSMRPVSCTHSRPPFLALW